MTAPDIDPRHLRSAVEFAVLMAQEGQKFKPPLAFPAVLKRHFTTSRIPTRALAGLVRVIDGDAAFRRKISVGAVPELVDEIGRLWLERPEGWAVEIDRLVGRAERAEAEAEAANELKRAEKRREAAERVAVRSRAELASLRAALIDRDDLIEALRADVAKLADELDAIRVELSDTRVEARHARDREQAALARQASAEADRAAAVRERGEAESVRDGVLADRAVMATERSELARLAAQAGALADQLVALSDPGRSGAPAPPRRKALPMPGGVMGDSRAAADYLMRSGASVLIDGYNVAKLAWPKLDLAGQRVVLLDAMENLARRYGSDMTVVFDGADVIGASADQRRVVRVVYSPTGVIADDVIRDEVGRLPAARPVVVATNDREIIADVRAMGANTISSQQLVALI